MPDASHDFGAHLRQARQQRGVSLREIAERTKISVLALEALERNDVSRLPGGIFSRAFVRSYAREVGLDAEDTVRRFVARFPDAAGEEAPTGYRAAAEHIDVGERPALARARRALVWSLPLLAGVAYFGFGGRLPVWGTQGTQAPAKTVEPQHPAVPPPPSSNETPRVEPARVVPVEPEAAQPAAPGGPPDTDAPAPTPVPAALPAAGQEQAEAAATPPPAAGSFRLTLAPREDCWVSVRMGGASVFSGLMRAGERKELTLSGDPVLTVGNASAMSFLIDDHPGPQLGTTGQVVTTRLTADARKTLIERR